MSVASPTSLIIAGGGGHARVVFDAALSRGLNIVGFLDDHSAAPLADLTTWLGLLESWTDTDRGAALFPAFGDAHLRRDLMAAWNEAGRDIANVCHDSALIGRAVNLARGVLVGPGAIINPGSRIGDGVIVNTGAIVEHDARIGDFAHVAPGVVMGGGVTIGAACLVGLGSRILPGLTIGEGAVIGAGAIITRNVDPHDVVTGVV